MRKISKPLWKEKYTAVEITSPGLSGHVQVALTVPSGLRFQLLSLRVFSAGLGEWRVLRSGQSSGALCYVLQRFPRGICGVAEHQDWSYPSRMWDVDKPIVVLAWPVSAFNEGLHQLFSLHSSHRTHSFPSLSSLGLASFMPSTCWAQPHPVEDVPAVIFIIEAGNHLRQSIVWPPSPPNLSWPGSRWAHCKVLWVEPLFVIGVHPLGHAHEVLTAIVFPVYMERRLRPKMPGLILVCPIPPLTLVLKTPFQCKHLTFSCKQGPTDSNTP